MTNGFKKVIWERTLKQKHTTVFNSLLLSSLCTIENICDHSDKMQTKIVPFIEWTRTFHFADKFLSFIQKLLFPISSSYLSITAVCFLVLVVEFSILYGPTDVYSVAFIVKKTSSGKNRPSSFLTLSASAAYPIPYSRWPTNKCNAMKQHFYFGSRTFLYVQFLKTKSFHRWEKRVEAAGQIIKALSHFYIRIDLFDYLYIFENNCRKYRVEFAIGFIISSTLIHSFIYDAIK